MIDPAEERRRLAETLRTLRTGAGLSTTQLASRLGWSQSKVSKTELGRTLPEPSDVAAWAGATDAEATARDELVAIAERAAVQAIQWRRELAPGRRRMQQEIQRLEAAASVIRVFSPEVVVGLAQTRAYAEAMFRLGRRLGPPEDLDEIVTARLARQAVLADRSKRFELVMAEAALRRRLVPAPEMRAQLARLAELTAQPNIAMGVIPFNAHEQVHQYHGFAVLGDPEFDDEAIVLAETVTRALTVRTAAEVAEYVAHFDALRGAAVEGEQLRDLLDEVSTKLQVD